jgi:hypothetical protein
MSHRGATPAPQPLLLGAAGHTCVAWWHAPAAAADTRAAPALPRGWLPSGPLPVAVVLASSWGEEDMSGYDGLRELATSLAEGGLGTLRFEWPDTGDSSAATGAASIADALAAFDAAATRALALSGCERLAFVGLRLGALLAAHAAVARQDVDALVALLPVASGRAFVREQRMLGAGLAAHAPAPLPGAAFDAAELPLMLGGFTQPVRHVEALSTLKWPSAATTSVLESLLLWPPDAPGRAASDALARMGSRVHEWAHVDLSGALAVAHRAGLAPLAIAEIVRWLQERAGDATVTHGVPEIADFGVADAGNCSAHAAAAAARLDAATAAVLALSAADAPIWMRLVAGGVAVRERIVSIACADGRDDPTLAGVLGERDPSSQESAPRPPRRAIVLLSSGRERRVGPHRMWVPWARHRAAAGDVVLRLDIAGIGDSDRRARRDAHGTPELYDPRCVDDIARAIAWLRREHGVGPCTVMGVCSGAHHAWRAALEGLDVQQVVVINPLIFHWKPGMSLDPEAHAFGQIAIAANASRSLLDPTRWWKLLSGRASVGVITGALAARARHALRLRLREIARGLRLPLEDDLAAELARASARGVALHFVFSAREPGLTLMREEAGRRGMRLVRDSRVKVCEVAHADHTFAGPAGRAELYARLDALLLPAPSMISPPVATPSHRPATARP